MARPAPETPPVGARLLEDEGEAADAPTYRGVSYCDAVGRAGQGEVLRILPGSIEVCRWSPVVLGLKAPAGRFEEGLAPHLAYPVAGLLLAPLDRFPGEPQVVLIRAGAETLWATAAEAGAGRLWAGHGGRPDRSALPLLLEGQAPGRRGLIAAVNRLLAGLAPWPAWQAFTRRLFGSQAVTAGFEAVVSRTLADMSICRNSTAIPLLTGQANVSFFCTGAITWGRNRPDHLTSGWPAGGEGE
ncbi:MAG: DUF169 domain-containing protein [Anaerolineae bacterium]